MVRRINPYIAGKPLWDRQSFFGREDVLGWVERELQNRGTNALVLFGQRRIGKTSILLQLQQSLPDDIFLPVYFDLQDQATRSLEEVLADLADTVTEEAGLEPPDPTAFDDQGRYFRRTFLPKLEKEWGTERRLVFLFDEFDVLDQVAENELPSTTAAKAFFPFLRRLMTENPWPAFVFIVGRRAEDLSLDFTATFKASLVRELWVLDQASAEQLIRQAVSNNTLRFTDSAVDRILTLTNRHPYLTQLLCQRIWERAYRARPASPPLIDIPDVEGTVADALKSGEQALIWLWNGLSPAEKIYAAALAEIAAEDVTIPEERVIQVLVTHAARLRTREVELASHDLVKRRVLEAAGEQEYRFSIELFRRWVHTNKPLRDVKDEIDQIDPVAEQLFNVGREEFRRRQWEKATGYFKDALERNSKHFRARLYLGECLLALGQIDSAVAELEQAYQLDKHEAKFALVRGLLSQAKTREKAGDEEEVLAVCERILGISPREREAVALQRASWTRRGDAALAKNDLEAALRAYQTAGDDKKTALVEILLPRQALATVERQAQTHVKAERWTKAAAIYQQLVTQAPDQQSRRAWERELKRCQEEQELAFFFAQGLEAMQKTEWVQAQQAFLQVVNRRVAYQKDGRWATELLDKSVKKIKAISIPSLPPIGQQKPRSPIVSQFKQIISTKNIKNIVQLANFDLENNVNQIAYSLDGSLLAVASSLGVHLYNVHILAKMRRIKSDTWMESVAFAPDNTRLAFGGDDNTVRFWNIKKYYKFLKLKNHTEKVQSIAFAPDGTILASVTTDKTIWLWRVMDGTLQRTLKYDSKIWSIDFAPDSQTLLSGASNNTVQLWNITRGKLLRTLTGHKKSVMSVSFSPDGVTCASGGADNNILLWRVSDGILQRTFKGHTAPVMSVAFSPDGSMLASAAGDSTVRLWNVSNGILLRTFKGNTKIVKSVAFAPDGTTFAWSGNDGTVQLWGIGEFETKGLPKIRLAISRMLE